MNNENLKFTTNSKNVSDKFEVGHRDVMRVINRLREEDNGSFIENNFTKSTYTSPQNKVFPCYEMTRDGFMILAMSLPGKKPIQWRWELVKTFRKMEEML